MVVEQVRAWISLWEGMDPKTKVEVEKAWVIEVGRRAKTPPQARWRRVGGPMAATIHVLCEQGWAPLRPDRWVFTPLELEGTIGEEPNTNFEILKLVKQVAKDAIWKVASRHRGGTGLEKGAPWWDLAKQVSKWFVKQGRKDEADNLKAITCGGQWEGSRVREMYPQVDKTVTCCPFCGEDDETLIHRYWTCSRLKTHADMHVKRTNFLIKEVTKVEARGRDCLWTRGLIPRDEWDVAPPPTSKEQAERSKSTVGDRSKWRAEGATLASDGGGAERQIDPLLAQVAAAFAAVDRGARNKDEVDKYVATCCQVPGRQTIPRAELWVLSMLLVERSGLKSEVWVDAEYVCKGVRAWGTRQQSNYAGGEN
jgi:hypothetical protein